MERNWLFRYFQTRNNEKEAKVTYVSFHAEKGKKQRGERVKQDVKKCYRLIRVRLIIFNLPETCLNSRLRAVIVNDPFHFFLEKKWSKKIGLRNKS